MSGGVLISVGAKEGVLFSLMVEKWVFAAGVRRYISDFIPDQ